ncbi:unnamed protein product [Ectocarpus sp. CCAP 1310/34]|nr:unnamed protein product [Ectocarpus sp. CCAP 1310/34]
MDSNHAPHYDVGDEMEIDLRPGRDRKGGTTTNAMHSGSPRIESGSHVPTAARPSERCGRCFRRKCVRVTFRLINLGFAAVFLSSAILQYNDDDGIAWAALYFMAAVFCILSELSWRHLRTFLVLPTLWMFTLCSWIGAGYVLIAQLLVGHAEGGASGEDAMDFYGLLLVSFWMSIVLLLDRHNVVGVFRGYTSLTEHERDREGHVQMGEVVI